MTLRIQKTLQGLVLIAASTGMAGCASLVTSATSGLTESLGDSIMNNQDLDMVRDGAPSFLLLMDGLIAQNPKSVSLLLQSSQLNSAYAAAFVTDPERARLLQQKALDHALQAVCVSIRNGCNLRTRPFDDFQSWLADRRVKEVPTLYQLASSWAGWIQANSDDFGAIAELARVKALTERIAALDDTYDYGGPELYLGVFETLLPPGMGGRPELGREHFERAIEISHGKYLLAKVMLAEQYARLVFDKELHDRLLEEVIAADPVVPGLTLINTVAQQRAKILLESSDAYF